MVSARERLLYESGTGILGGKPLPKPASAETGPADSSLRSQFKEWARQHEQYPHCWGVVDANHDPHKCMAEADAKRAAADKAQKARLAKPNEEKFDWSSEWMVEGDGLPVWDRSNSRYDDKDREAARVAFYASKCWGEHYATRDNPLLYDQMKRRMDRDECPEQEGNQEQADETKSDYEASLADALGTDGPGSGELSHGAANPGDNSGKEDYAVALSRTLDEDAENTPNEYQEALNRLETLQEKSRLDREEGARKTEAIDPQPASQSQSGGVNCMEEHPGVKQSMFDAAERAKSDYNQAYRAAINIARAVIWMAKECLQHDRNLSATQRSALKSQITLTREAIAQNTESARRALGAQAGCPCWSQYCAN